MGVGKTKKGEYMPAQVSARFQALYGMTPKLCSKFWNEYLEENDEIVPMDFLIGLYFLRQYVIEPAAAQHFGLSEKTLRQKWWKVLKILSKLDRKLV